MERPAPTQYAGHFFFHFWCSSYKEESLLLSVYLHAEDESFDLGGYEVECAKLLIPGLMDAQ